MDQDSDDDDLLGEEMIDYEVSLECLGMDINVIAFSVDYNIVGDDESIVPQFDFGLKEAIFAKPKE